ncbi:hypothetical protein CHS0354_009356 [Potamilus streckersoni]|uniref:Uncharacterized protein n=1 Tax=Potamilus streckersoni TaxID=2493646 RepID=A0AAE0WC65_9BIVA|nr:hypothetical protein CHS0354_009356 [Potamilus streckersoni]
MLAIRLFLWLILCKSSCWGNEDLEKEDDTRFYQERMFEAVNVSKSNISLYIHSDFQSDITWSYTTDDFLYAFVTLIADDVVVFNNIIGDISTTSDTINISISERVLPPSFAVSPNSAQTSSGFVIVTFLAAGCLMILSRDWRCLGWLYLIVSLILAIVKADVQGMRRVKVDIKSPRHMHFSNINLQINGGQIDIRNILKETYVSITCSTSEHPDQGCPFCCHGNGVCRDNTCHCKGNFDNKTYCDTKKPISTLFVSTSDPRLMQSVLPNGDIVDIYGTKNADSSNVRFQSYRLRTVPDFQLLEVDFDQDSNVRKISSPNGYEMILDWVSNCTLDGYIWTADGMKKNLRRISLCQSMRTSLDDIKTARNVIKRNKMGTHNYFSRPTRSVNRMRIPVKNDDPRLVYIPIIVRQCGQSYKSAEVSAIFEPIGFEDNITAQFEIRAQRYEYSDEVVIQAPNTLVNQDHINTRKLCKSVLRHAKGLCRRARDMPSKLLCLNIQVEEIPNDRNNSPIEIFRRICNILYESVNYFCENIFRMIEKDSVGSCEDSFENILNIFDYHEFNVIPVAKLTENRILRGVPRHIFLNRSVGMEVSPLLIEDNKPLFKITSITVNPKDPAPLDVYQVRVDYICATNFTAVKMDVTGSDKYWNSATCFGINPCSCCTLHAAGASNAVIDQVTIHVTDTLTSVNLTKELVIVF